MPKFDLKTWLSAVVKWTYGDATNAAPKLVSPESLVPPIAAEAATDAPTGYMPAVPAWTLDVKEGCHGPSCEFRRLARRMYAVHPN